MPLCMKQYSTSNSGLLTSGISSLAVVSSVLGSSTLGSLVLSSSTFGSSTFGSLALGCSSFVVIYSMSSLDVVNISSNICEVASNNNNKVENMCRCLWLAVEGSSD